MTLTIAALESWPWDWCLDSTEHSSDADVIRPKSSNGTARTRQEQGHNVATEQSTDLKNSTALVQVGNLRKCLLLAAFACIMRPTNVLIWAVLTCFTLFRLKSHVEVIPTESTEKSTLITTKGPALRATKRQRYTLVKEVILCGYVEPIITFVPCVCIHSIGCD